ncbi:MAG: O-antigen ligase family protein [Rhodospirillales bacterium]
MKHGKSDTAAVLCFGALPVVAAVVEKGSVVLLVVLALLGIVSAFRRGALASLLPIAATVVAVVVLAWIGYRGVDTFNGEANVTKFLSIAALVALAFAAAGQARLMAADTRARALDAICVGIAVSLLIVAVGCVVSFLNIRVILHAIERADKLSVFSSGMVVIALLTPMAVTHLVRQGRKLHAAGLALAGAVLAALSGSNAAVLAFAVIAATAPLLWKFPRVMPRLVAAGCVLGTLALPPVVTLSLKFFDDGARPTTEQTYRTDPDGAAGSLGHRYYIWRFATERALERPLAGWGLDTSRAIPGGHENIAIGKELMPLHPHNATLQLWLELGVPGVLIGALVYLLLFRYRFGDAMSDVEVFIKPLTLAAVFVVANATYGIWQTWWLSALALVVAAMFMWDRKPAENR